MRMRYLRKKLMRGNDQADMTYESWSGGIKFSDYRYQVMRAKEL